MLEIKKIAEKTNLKTISRGDRKVTYNGYWAIYMPEHHRAFKNGCVYEHILVAEKMLGRPLKDEEVVHHKDFDRKNNDPINLMVFANDNFHIMYHYGAEAILQSDGSYICKTDESIIYEYKYIKVNKNESSKVESIRKCRKNVCTICNKNYKDINSRMCIYCRRKEQAKNIPTKEELGQYVYEIPFEQIGRMYGVSGKAVTKWCKKYGLPYRKKDMSTNQQ